MKIIVEIDTKNLSLEAKRLIARQSTCKDLLKALALEESDIEVKAYLSMNPATPNEVKKKLKNNL